MPITRTTHPYEFLVRWKDGVLAGAHVGFLERVIDEDGSVLSQRELDVQPVAVAGASGFPLDQILTEIQASAIARGDALQAMLSVAQTELSDARDQAAALSADVTALGQQLAAAQAEIQRLTAPLPQIIVP